MKRLLYLLPLISGCSEQPAIPKPYGFHRIELPKERSYRTFASSNCPFTFEYPSNGIIQYQPKDECWVDIYFPQFDCKWHITYKDLKGNLDEANKLYEEYRSIVYKHSQKARDIQTKQEKYPAGTATFYEIYGNVPTSAQFYFTNSTRDKAIMTSFYFNTALKNDSLAPIIDYMKVDLKHFLQTIQWK
ncbi:MAG: hypothetical protein NZ108_08700 [Bacteroidia bacterium]|nr:hypothetical protein [Bacteroidia bacterium]